MKANYAKWVGLMAAVALSLVSGYSQAPGDLPPQGATAAPVALSPAAAEVVRLAESGTAEDVLLAYIQKTIAAYNLSADDVVYLKDVGLTSPVITAMLNHDKSVPGQTYTYNQQAYPPTGQIPPPPAPVPEQQPVAPPAEVGPAPTYVSAPPPTEVNYFYHDLSPYGSWVQLEGYGWCWQPRTVVINHEWRPYCDGGHWVYSDAGWFWASDYSWGWATFHYGRWHMHPRCGWVWFPDTVWAPAWVVWRSSGDHCGWAPLPYRATFDERAGFRFNGVGVRADFDFGLGVNLFTFVALGDFRARDLGHRRLPPVEVNRIYNHTTIINNYTVNNNHVIVNHGIPVERISTATHTQIRTVALHDLPAGSSKPVVRGGAEATVYRHELRAPTRISTPVVAQKIDERHPVIQHTPVAPTGFEHRTTTGTATPTPTYTPGRNQRDISSPLQHPQQQQQPTGEKYTPRTQVSPPAHLTETKEPSRPVQTSTPAPTMHYSTTTTPAKVAPLQTVTTDQNPHVYYPKSYHQSASTYALPPESGTGGAGRSSSSSSSSAGQQVTGSHGQSQGQSRQFNNNNNGAPSPK